jgi:hypothetical protein
MFELKIKFHRWLNALEFFFMNNLNKLPLGVDFTAGGIKSITNHPLRISPFAQNSLRIYSANFLQCMNVKDECFDISNTQVFPKKMSALFI